MNNIHFYYSECIVTDGIVCFRTGSGCAHSHLLCRWGLYSSYPSPSSAMRCCSLCHTTTTSSGSMDPSSMVSSSKNSLEHFIWRKTESHTKYDAQEQCKGWIHIAWSEMVQSACHNLWKYLAPETRKINFINRFTSCVFMYHLYYVIKIVFIDDII